MKERFQLLCALVVAALFSDILDKTTWTRARAVFTVWFGKHGERVSEEVFQERMAACRECPLFYPPLQTCSSPLNRETRDMGCYCHEPTAARLKTKTCWLRDEVPDSEYGWRI